MRLLRLAALLLTASCGGSDGGSPPVAPSGPTVRQVTITPAHPSVAPGTSLALSAQALDSMGAPVTGRTATWQSANISIATVSADGTLQGVAAGSVEIDAVIGGVSGRTIATVAPTPVGRVSISPNRPSLVTGQTIQLTAQPQDANGTALSGRAVTWGSLDASIATVNASGLVTAVAAGTARITATSENVIAADTVTVTPPPVAQIRLGPTALYVPTGQTAPLTTTLTDASGHPVARTPTFTSSNPNVVQVDASGTVTGVSAGVAQITATADQATASVSVTAINGGFVFALSDTVLAPNSALIVAGNRLASGRVTVNGANATTAGATASSFTFTPPSALFAPCLAPGHHYAVVISANGGSASISLPAAEVPLTVSLAVGQYTLADAAVASGCSLEAQEGGQYVAMPYTWDNYDPGTSGYTVPAPLAARLSVRAGGPPVTLTRAPLLAARALGNALMPAALSRPTVSRTSPLLASDPRLGRVGASTGAPQTAPAHPAGLVPRLLAGSSARTPSDVRIMTAYVGGSAGAHRMRGSASRSASVVTLCPTPTTLGQTISVGTVRSNGLVVGLNNTAGGGTAENWTLVALSNRIAVFFDSTMLRVGTNNAPVQTLLHEMSAGYDSVSAPIIDRYTTGMPDQDGNGRVVILVPYTTTPSRAYAFPRGYARMDCPSGTDVGEAIYLPSILGVAPQQNASSVLRIATHESAHIVEVPLAQATAGNNRVWWSHEGYASMFEYLYTIQGRAAPFTSNLSSYLPGRTIAGATDPGSSACVVPDPTLPAQMYPYNTPAGYSMGCQVVTYAVQRLVSGGMAPADAVKRYLTLTDKRTMTSIINGMLGQSKPAEQVVGPLFLSWVADDAAPNIPPELSNAMYNIPKIYASFSSTVYAWPLYAAHFGSTGGSLDLTLREPDVYFTDVTSSGPVRIRLAQPDGTPLPTTRTTFALLRVR